MAVLSTKQIERHTPAHRESDPVPPVYLIAPMDIVQKARWRSALAREGVTGYPSEEDLARAVREAVEEVAPANLAECLEAVDVWLGLLAAPPLEPLPEGQEEDEERREAVARRRAALDAYAAVERAMSVHPRVSSIRAERVLFGDIAPSLAAAYALRGWENVKVEFKLVNGVVPLYVLGELDENDLRDVGYKAMSLLRVSETERKN